jgi:hypothetical protein
LKNKLGQIYNKYDLEKSLIKKIVLSYQDKIKSETIIKKNKRKIFIGGGNDDDDNNNNNDQNIDQNINQNINQQNDIIDLQYEEFDIDNINNLEDINSKEIHEDNKLISEILNINSSKDNIVPFDNSKDESNYNSNLADSFIKYYIYNNKIYNDDSIINIKNKICNSIGINKIFNDKYPYIIPSRIYLWSKYNYINKNIINNDENIIEDNIMLGSKWLKNNIIYNNILIEPHNNLGIYETLDIVKTSNNNYDMNKLKKNINKIKHINDDHILLNNYEDYIINNEIYMIDIYNELGLNYDKEELDNIY